MQIEYVIGFFLSIFVLVKSASYTVKSMSALARFVNLSEFLVSLIIFGFVSALPETSLAWIAAAKGSSEISYGVLMGSNIADLSLILGLIVLIGGTLRMKERKTSHDILFILLTLLPLLFASNKIISRVEGSILILACIVFFMHIARERKVIEKLHHLKGKPFEIGKQITILIISLIALFFSANFVVKFTNLIAIDLAVSAVLISLTLLALGTCLPELSFAIASVKKHHDDLAIGDILGNVIIDATAILGIAALIRPIVVDTHVVFITGVFLTLIIVMLLSTMRYRKALTVKEGLLLIFTYLVFIVVELLAKGM